MSDERTIKISSFQDVIRCLLPLMMAVSSLTVILLVEASVSAPYRWSSPIKICNGYYPSLVQLNESIWLAYTNTEGGANEVRAISSSDGALTWSSPRVIFEAKTEWVAWSAQGTTFLSSNGELWLAWHANRNPAGGTAEIWYTKSVDNGVTWFVAKKPYEEDAPWNGYGWPRLVEMQNKIWLFFTHTQSSKYMTTSDRGSSWSGPFEVTPYYSQKQYPSADYINDEIWLVYTKWDPGPPDEHGMTPGQEIHLVKSSDGSTWSEPQKISNATAPFGAQSVALIKYYNSKPFVFFTSWADQKWGVYLTTSDDGVAWSNPEKVVDNVRSDFSFSLAIIDGRLWLVFTSSDGEIFYITLKPLIVSTVHIAPDTLNLRSNGDWIDCYIELPEHYSANDINVSSILLNETVSVDLEAPTQFGDYDDDGVPDLMVKFDRAEVISYILANVNVTKLLKERFMIITLTVSGYLNDGALFQGSDKIKTMLHIPKYHISTE